MSRPLTLILDASPSPRGNSFRLAEAMLEALGGGFDRVRLYEAAPAPCRACGACAAGRPCRLDGVMDGILRRLGEADFLIAASPLHNSSLSAPLVAFFSRLQPFWQARRRGEAPPGRPRQAALAVTGGAVYPGMFAPARAAAAAAFKSLGVPFAGMAAASGTDRQPVDGNPAALAGAVELAGRMLAAGGRAGAPRAE